MADSGDSQLSSAVATARNKLANIWDVLNNLLISFYDSENFDTNIVVITLTACVLSLLIYIICRRREVLIPVIQPSSGPRFRKRDKMKYYARKILRKSRQVVNQARKPPRSRQEFLKLAGSVLKFPSKSHSKKLIYKEPPAAILETDLVGQDSDSRLPTEYLYLLRNVQVFGHLEKPVYMEICKSMLVHNYRANQLIFNIGDPDDSIYVLTEGHINVFVREQNGEERLIKEVEPGDSIHSLLSIMDVLTGHPAPYKTVFARAERDSTVLKLPASSFQRVFADFPESMLRVVQVIMVRLIRVTFWALHNYLGLDQQLMNSKVDPGVAELLSPDGIKTLDSRTDLDGNSIESDAKLKEICKKDLVRIFDLGDESLLDDKLTICHYRADRILCRVGDADADLIFIIKGQLLVTQKVIGKDEMETVMFAANPGEIVGVLAVLSGEPSIFGCKTSQPTIVAHITKSAFYSLMKLKPSIVLSSAHLLVKRLSPFVRQIDFALDWILIESGRALYKKGAKSDHLYIILNGRIRTIMEVADGKKTISGEYGKGELIGVGEIITNSPRAMTAMAVRDTELAQLPAQLLDHIRVKYPQIITRLYHLLGDRLMGIQNRLVEENLLKENPGVDPRSPIANISTVCVVPASDKVPLTAFTLELQHALSTICDSLRLTSDIITEKLGAWAHNRPNEYRLSSWLSAQEDAYRTVIYQCDYKFTSWTQRCIRQSDVILIVALADESHHPGPLEKSLEGMAVRSQKELILLHKADAVRPQNTVDWLNAREWCLSHHHIRCPNRVFSTRPTDKLFATYEKVVKTNPDPSSDMCRLARFLTGTAIGLVLGGGGARGAAQIGLIKAMVEAGIPIDMVGGTSIGSFVGALWCEERNIVQVIIRARQWFKTMTSLWKKILDLTYPITSMMTGYSFNRTIEDVFRDTQIEDLWIPYFNITTDITASKMRVHTSGDLWRYVRSSMSLSGYLPPLCDPKDGHLLLDGGYVNNLPADVMKASGASIIFAVDVGAQEDRNYTNYGDHLSGFWLLWKRWNPWSEPVRVPGMEEIQSHLAYISCVKNLEHIKRVGMCDYIRPPIDKFQTLQFQLFEDIMEVGYNFARPYFQALVQTEKMRTLLRPPERVLHKHISKTYVLPDNSSFTDLANIMSDKRSYSPVGISFSDLAVGTKLPMDETDNDDIEDESHSEDIDDSNESSPSAQSSPRELSSPPT